MLYCGENTRRISHAAVGTCLLNLLGTSYRREQSGYKPIENTGFGMDQVARCLDWPITKKTGHSSRLQTFEK